MSQIRVRVHCECGWQGARSAVRGADPTAKCCPSCYGPEQLIPGYSAPSVPHQRYHRCGHQAPRLWTYQQEPERVDCADCERRNGPAPKYLAIRETSTELTRYFTIPPGLKPLDQSQRRRTGLARRRGLRQ